MMRKALSSQKTKLLLENPGAAPAATGLITSVSKSQPASLVFADIAALAVGDPVLIIGTGFASLDGRSWVIATLDINTRVGTLANSDTSRETVDYSPNAAWIKHAFTDLCVTTYTITQSPAAQISVTSLCSESQEFITGFSDPGTMTADFFLVPDDPDYLALREAQQDGEERLLRIVYRNKAVRTVPVIVQAINESGGVDQAVQGSLTLKLAGPDVLTMPPEDQIANYVLIPVAVPSSGNAPLYVTLTLNESGGSASSFEIDWKDGSTTTITTAHSSTHTYDNAGQFRPSVVATIAGNDTAPFNANIVTVQETP
ncbi:putative secreted protein [Paraburkholderia youngii]|uniref:phage tail tube protein n=1 Tax=Paraburkholderia youngii TaxID=2782701 RepID=UPI003D1A507F